MRPRDHPKTKIIIFITFLILGLFGLSLSGAVKGATGVPKIIQFQGRLLDVNSNLLGGSAGTSYCFRFSVYDNATVGAGTKLWPAGTPSGMKVTTTSGVFNVGVGDTVAGGDALTYNFQDNNTVYLNVEVATLVGATCAAGDGAESWENVSPRQQIVSSGYAINASTLLGLTPYEYASSTEILVLSGGNLNLGGTNPQINATGSQALTFQGNGGTGNIQFFSASNTLTSSGALTVAGAITAGNGLTLSTGTLNLTSTSGLVALTLSSSTTAFNVNNQLVVDTTNNRVGIGTASPSTTLHVVSSNLIPVLEFQSVAGPGSEPRMDIIGQDGSGTTLWFAAGVKGGAPFQNTFSGAISAHDYELRTNNSGRVTIKAGTGNVGIGTTVPSTTLHVIGTGRFSSALTLDNGLTLTTGALTLTATSGSANLTLSSSTTAFNVNNQLVVDTTNNRVGIGTTSPSTTLHVLGGITATSLNASSATVSGLTSGSVLFAGSGGSVSQSNTALFWDNTNGRLGLGTTSPAAVLDIKGPTTSGSASLLLRNGDNSTATVGDTQIRFGWSNTDQYQSYIRTRHNASAANNAIDFYTGDGTASGVFPTNAVLGLSVNNGQVGIGTTSPSTTLHVAGNISLTGGSDIRPLTDSPNALKIANGNAGLPFAFFDSTNGRLGLGFGAISPSSTLHVSGTALFKPGTDSTTAFQIQPSSSTTPVLNIDSINARVGIGNNSPGVTFDVTGTGRFSSGLTLTTGALTLTATSGSANLTLSSSTTAFNVNNQLVVDTTNNRVGIGTTSPDEKLQVAGDIHFTNTRTRTMTRTIPTTVGNEVDIGAFTMTAGLYFEVWITVPTGGYAQSKRYFFPAPYNATVGAWKTVVPISTSGPYGGGFEDTDLEININSLTTTLRLRRVGGTNVGTAYITILQQGVDTDPFTASTATSTVTAPTSTYTHTLITQLSGNVGIGITSPLTTLDVGGSGRFNATSTTAFQIQSSSTGLTFDSLNNRLGIGTTTPESTLQVGSPSAGTTGVMPLIRFIGTFQSSTEATILRLARGVNSGIHYAGSADFKMKAYSDAGVNPFTQLTLALKSTSDLVETANVDVITFRDTGNVGIGTTSPSTTLHVVGTGRFSSGLTLDNGLTLTTGALTLTATSGSANLTLSSSTTAFNVNNQLVVDTTNNRVGIGTTAPGATFQVRPTPVDVGSFVLTNTPAFIKSLTNNGGTTPAAAEPVLTLGREGIGGQAYANFADFKISRYVNSGVSARTRLDLGLTQGDGDATTTNIMSWRGDGTVGIGTTSPSTTLHVIGTITATSLNASSATLSGLTSGSILFAGTGGSVSESNTKLYWDNTNGRLGVGVSTPSTTLYVSGTTIFKPGTDSTTVWQIQSSSSTTPIVNIDSITARVGIGNNAPSTTLHITGTGRFSSGLTLDNGLTLTTGALTLTTTSGSANLTLSSSTTAFNVNNQLVVDTTNNRVGVGTTSPSTTLTVQGNISLLGGSDIRPLTDSPNALKIANGNAGLPFAFFDSTNGRLGLGFGATSPSSTLHVSGTALFKNGTNSTIAFQIQPFASTTPVLNVDTTNSRVGIGTATPITQLHIPGTVPTAATGSVTTGTTPNSVYVQGRYAYVTNQNSSTLQIFDVSNPAAPTSAGSVTTGTTPNSVYVQGRYAYVANNGSNSLQIFDVSNPVAPVSVGTVTTGAGPISVYVQGRYAYVANNSGNSLQIFDASNPAAPVSVGSVSTGAGTNPYSVYVQGRYAYVVNNGSSTLQIFDASNPVAPVSVGTVTTGAGAGPISVYVQGRYAYVANYSGATLKIFDVSNPAAPTSAGSVAAGTNPISVYVQGRYAYVANQSSATLQIFDVSTPATPTSVGTVTTGAGPTSVYVQGRYAYVANNGSNSLQIFDVGGAYIQQLEVGGIETGTFATRSNLQVGNDADIRGGLTVGQNLQVSGNIGASGLVLFQDTTNSVTAFQVQNAAGAGLFIADTTNGRVGIGVGVISPSSTLHVSGTALFKPGTDSTTAFQIQPSSSTTPVLNIDSINARVGIGNNSPGVTFDVTGTGRFSSTLTASNGLTLTTGALTLTATSGSANLTLSSSTTAFNVNNQLVVDTTNNRVGVGTTSPSFPLDVLSGTGVETVANFTTGLTAGAGVYRTLNLALNKTTAVNDGPAFFFRAKDANGTMTDLADIAGIITDRTAGAASGALTFTIRNAGTLVDRMIIDKSGNVGIGTTVPSTTLHVIGTGRFSSALTLDNGLTLTTGALTLTATSGSANLTLSSSTTAFNVNNFFDVDTTNNRVGIGTTSPNTAKLHIRGGSGSVYSGAATPNADTLLFVDNNASSNSIGISASATGTAGIRFANPTDDSAGTILFNNSTNSLTFKNSTNATTAFQIQTSTSTAVLDVDTTNGRVGIGTANPSVKFQVTGAKSFSVNPDFTATNEIPTGINVAARDTNLSFSANSVSGTAGDKIALTYYSVSGGIWYSAAEIANVSSGFGNLLLMKTGGNVGIGTTSPSTTLHVAGAVTVNLPGTGTGNALCHTTQTGTIKEEIVDCTSAPVADYMEIYPTEPNVEPGDILVTGSSYAITKDGDQISKLAKSTGTYQSTIIGIVSDPKNAGDFNSIGYNVNEKDHPLPIALNGRVKVRVSGENGPIEAGDLITTSLIPGVGMKATKAGPVIGRALSSYDGANVGIVTVFVSNGYFNGKSVTSALPGISGVNQLLGASSINLGKQILLQLITRRGEISSDLRLSEITTDRFTAGLEVITPRVVTQELVVDSLEAASGGDLALNLDKGKFVIKHRDLNNESSTEAVVSIDSAGNAFFAGGIKAGSITAGKISGLELITNKISLLNNKVESLAADQSSTLSANNLEVNGSASILGSLKALKIISNEIESPTLLTLKNGLAELASSTEGVKLEVSSTTERVSQLTANLGELGKRLTAVEESQVALSNILGKDKGTEISGVSILKGGLQVNKISAADNEIAFMSDAVFFGRPYFTADTAGFGVILQGQKEVKITFEKEYIEKPVVNATVSLDEAIANSTLEEMILNGDLRYIVTRVSAKGFTILINKSAPANIQFSWTALAVKNPKTFFSLKEAEPPITPLAKPMAPTSSQALSGSGSSTQAGAVPSSTELIITSPKSSSTEPVITPPGSLSGTPPPPAEATSTVKTPPAQAKPSSIEASPPPVIKAPSSSAPSEPAPASSGTPRG